MSSTCTTAYSPMATVLRNPSLSISAANRGAGKVNASFLEALPTVKVIASVSVGIDHIDLQAANQVNVAVFYANGVNAWSVAEHTLALILTHVKRILEGHQSVLRGYGETVWTRTPDKRNDLKESGVQFGSLESIIDGAGLLTLHVSLNNDTRALITPELLSTLAPDAIVVNVARQELFSDYCLPRIKQLRPDLRFAIDDFDLKRNGTVDQLGSSGLYTPHVAGATKEVSQVASNMVEQNTLSRSTSVALTAYSMGLAIVDGAFTGELSLSTYTHARAPEASCASTRR